jgi:hypothetical protein
MNGYRMFWPDGRGAAVVLNAFCRHGERVLGLDRHLVDQPERLIDILCFPVGDLGERMTRCRECGFVGSPCTAPARPAPLPRRDGNGNRLRHRPERTSGVDRDRPERPVGRRTAVGRPGRSAGWVRGMGRDPPRRGCRLRAPVGQPVPTKHALDADDDAVAERRDGLEQGLDVTQQVPVEDDRAGGVRDADVHRPCMQIDAGIAIRVGADKIGS